MKKRTEFYKFTKDFKINGLKVLAGVSLKGPFLIEDNKLSVIGSSIFKNISLDMLEKYVIERTKKKKNRAKIEAKSKTKTSSESARISDKKV